MVWALALLDRPGALLRGGEAFVDFGPVDDVPEGLDVVGAAVLVVEVVGVFPDVEAEDWGFAFGQRGVLVGGAFDGQLALVGDEPGPAAAEPLGGGVVKQFLELLEAAEGGVDGRGDCAVYDRDGDEDAVGGTGVKGGFRIQDSGFRLQASGSRLQASGH